MIRCKALEENSIFVSAEGHVLPCCYIHRGGATLPPPLLSIIQGNNFEKLVASWNSPNPYPICKMTCDDRSIHAFSLAANSKEWKADNT